MLRIGSDFFLQSTCFATKRPLVAIVNDLPISPLEVDAMKYIKLFNKLKIPSGMRAFTIFRGKRACHDQNIISEWSLMDQDEMEVLKHK